MSPDRSQARPQSRPSPRWGRIRRSRPTLPSTGPVHRSRPRAPPDRLVGPPSHMTPSSPQPCQRPPTSASPTGPGTRWCPRTSRRLLRTLAVVLAAAAIGSVILTARPAAAGASSDEHWSWPLPPPVTVVAGFHPPAHPWLPGHRGVDLAGSLGFVVRAAGAGMVVFAGRIGPKGVVVVLHAGGLRTTYEPLDPLVTPGQRVSRDEPIGRVEADGSHCGHRPWCLHWGLRRGLDYLDPLMLVSDRRPVLLPVAEASGWDRAAVSDPGNSRGPLVETLVLATPAGSQEQGRSGSTSAAVTIAGTTLAGGLAVSAVLWRRRRRIRPNSFR